MLFRSGLKISTDKIQNKEVLKMAEILRSKREIQLVAQLNGIIDPESTKITLVEYMEQYSKFKGKQSQIWKVIPWIERLSDPIKLVAVTPAWFENFQARMDKESNLAPATKEKYCSRIREAFKKAVRDGILQRDPSTGIKHISVPESSKPYLEPIEIKKLIETKIPCEEKMGNEIKAGFLFAICTGLRFSDIITLAWEIGRASGRESVCQAC